MTILHNGQALLIAIEEVDARVLDLYPNLKVIGTSTTGTDHIDLEECRKRGIEVISLQYAGQRDRDVEKLLDSVTSTAEHTIGLIIALMRNYKTALNPPYKHRDEYMGHSLKGKKILLIGGLGRVGRQVEQMAKGFGMDVYVHDKMFARGFLRRWRRTTGFYWGQGLKFVLSQMDIVSIHVPLPDNEGMFTREMFQCMKPSAYFINTSRSGVVAPEALLWALEEGEIAGASVDFTDEQGLVDYASQHNNLILTNHIAGVTYEDRQKTSDFIKKKVNDFMENNL